MKITFDYPDKYDRLPSRLKFLRISRKLTLNRLCDIAGCDPQAYLDLENYVEFPDEVSVVLNLCAFYGETDESLLGTVSPAEYFYLISPEPISADDLEDAAYHEMLAVLEFFSNRDSEYPTLDMLNKHLTRLSQPGLLPESLKGGYQ